MKKCLFLMFGLVSCVYGDYSGKDSGYSDSRDGEAYCAKAIECTGDEYYSSQEICVDSVETQLSVCTGDEGAEYFECIADFDCDVMISILEGVSDPDVIAASCGAESQAMTETCYF